MELNRKNYYQTHMLSVSTVKLFVINRARALADYHGEESWFGDHNLVCALHQMLEDAMTFTNNSINVCRIFNENHNDE